MEHATMDNLSAEVFYDGGCPVCSRESGAWKKRDKVGHFCFIDISSLEFRAEAYGLDAKSVNEVMHVRTSAGRVITGFEAILYIWKSVPGFRILYHIFSLPVIKTLGGFGYRLFARYRPRLKRGQDTLFINR
jgi:predicted DCC family thiol-disulfide oxidoreductase YuxK